MGFTYNKANRLATVTSGSGTVLSYVYDGFGQRITKTDTAQRFQAYDWQGRYIEETDNTDTVKQDYIYLNGQPVATFVPNASTGTLSFLHTDRLGTPRLATSSTKAVGWNATASDPFNAPNSVSGNSIANDLRMPGQEYELGSGHNHNGFRDYAPALGRYLQSDPVGLIGGGNTYAYAENNPAILVDPLGLLRQYSASFGGTVNPFLFSVGGGFSLGVVVPDRVSDISGYQLFGSVQGDATLGFGLYAGWGFSASKTQVSSYNSALSAQLGYYGEGDVGIGAVGLSGSVFVPQLTVPSPLSSPPSNGKCSANINPPTYTAGNPGIGPLKLLPGEGIGGYVGIGGAGDVTIALPTFGQIGSFLNEFYNLFIPYQ